MQILKLRSEICSEICTCYIPYISFLSVQSFAVVLKIDKPAITYFVYDLQGSLVLHWFEFRVVFVYWAGYSSTLCAFEEYLPVLLCIMNYLEKCMALVSTFEWSRAEVGKLHL